MIRYPHKTHTPEAGTLIGYFEVEPLPARDWEAKDKHIKISEMTGRQRRCLAEYWAPIYHGIKQVYSLSDCAQVLMNNISVSTVNQLTELEHVYKERERCHIPVTLGTLNHWMSCHRSSQGLSFSSSASL